MKPICYNANLYSMFWLKDFAKLADCFKVFVKVQIYLKWKVSKRLWLVSLHLMSSSWNNSQRYSRLCRSCWSERCTLWYICLQGSCWRSVRVSKGSFLLAMEDEMGVIMEVRWLDMFCWRFKRLFEGLCPILFRWIYHRVLWSTTLTIEYSISQQSHGTREHYL